MTCSFPFLVSLSFVVYSTFSFKLWLNIHEFRPVPCSCHQSWPIRTCRPRPSMQQHLGRAPARKTWRAPCCAWVSQIFFPLICFRLTSHKPQPLASCFHSMRPAQRKEGIPAFTVPGSFSTSAEQTPSVSPPATQNYLPIPPPPLLQPQLLVPPDE